MPIQDSPRSQVRQPEPGPYTRAGSGATRLRPRRRSRAPAARGVVRERP